MHKAATRHDAWFGLSELQLIFKISAQAIAKRPQHSAAAGVCPREIWNLCPRRVVVIFSMAPLKYGIIRPFLGIERRWVWAGIEGSR